MTMLIANTCIGIIMLVVIYITVMSIIISVITSTIPGKHINRIRKIVGWMFFVSVPVLIVVAVIISSSYL